MLEYEKFFKECEGKIVMTHNPFESSINYPILLSEMYRAFRDRIIVDMKMENPEEDDSDLHKL